MSDVPPPAPKKKRGCLVPALVAIIVTLLLLFGFWLWHNRPIKPVTLDPAEKAALEAKLEAVQKPARAGYEKGAKEIILTEHELNGLLNENTDMGSKLQFELVAGAVQARYETDVDKDVPLVGGRRMKGRARFTVTNDGGGSPKLVLEDLTLWGISLPNEWLGGLKGHDLLGDALGEGNRGGLPGVEDIKVEDGLIRIKLKD